MRWDRSRRFLNLLSFKNFTSFKNESESWESFVLQIVNWLKFIYLQVLFIKFSLKSNQSWIFPFDVNTQIFFSFCAWTDTYMCTKSFTHHIFKILHMTYILLSFKLSLLIYFKSFWFESIFKSCQLISCKNRVMFFNDQSL